jgi:hypothetical protein
MPPPSRLDVFKYAPHHDEYLSTVTEPDPNAKTRRDVAQCFIQTCGLNMWDQRNPINLRRFYALMRVNMKYAATTAETYLMYVIRYIGHSVHEPRVRDIIKLAKRRSAIDEPVRTVRISDETEVLKKVLAFPELERRGAILMMATGARCRDVARLKPQEVLVDPSDAAYKLQVSFSETKQRKARNSWVTIQYPTAILRDEFKEVLQRCMTSPGSPCEGLSTDRLNRMLHAAGLPDTTKGLRLQMHERLSQFLETTGSPVPMHQFTGHKGSAWLSSYDRLRHLDKTRRALGVGGAKPSAGKVKNS